MFVQWDTGTRGMPNTKMKRNQQESLKHYHCKKLRQHLLHEWQVAGAPIRQKRELKTQAQTTVFVTGNMEGEAETLQLPE